ncbi:unnamed protein product [Rhizophagus irregularis]|uniref:Uncharacterized protein n=1 Tax=Rhizophagus irregularis TaxID=588596 RepID=A0A916EA90_9GLOM|nr:unnamed protein product [Rhizophagus irregularis]CAB4484133.1 unnamed protein product [Rhizophagus irregularis]CAB5123090.1 unnamed protein product [Rhizophagus irregularis]CAB5314858.1 unnamed protein product [Rhizophagus irregularis]CAB5372563.1 unnamed protein product [Rhizophagus irregularis]
MELLLYRCKLFFRALNEGKTSFFFSDAPKWLHSDENFFPQYIKAPLHGLYGEYSWKQEDTNNIIKLIIKTLPRVYPFYFTSEMASIDYTNRNKWISFNSSHYLMNRLEANLQDKLVQNSVSLFPKNWLLGFKFLYEYDWHPVPNRPDKGRNDIILTNGKGIFAVVEAKVINSHSDKYQKYRDVKGQATDYKKMFLERFADDPAVIAVIGVWFTNENYYKENFSIGFTNEIDQTIAKAVEPDNPHLLGYLLILRGILGSLFVLALFSVFCRMVIPNFYWTVVYPDCNYFSYNECGILIDISLAFLPPAILHCSCFRSS